MKWIKGLFALAISFIIVAIVAGITSFLVRTDTAWFVNLELPDMPSSIIIELVWTGLYILLATYVVRLCIVSAPKMLFVLTGLQFLGQILCCLFFFRVHFEWISLLLILGITIAAFVQIACTVRYDIMSVWLLLPYVIWLSYLCSLAYLIVMMN